MHHLPVLLLMTSCSSRVVSVSVECEPGDAAMTMRIDGVPQGVSLASDSGHAFTVKRHEGTEYIAEVPYSALPPNERHEVVLARSDEQVHLVARCIFRRPRTVPSLWPRKPLPSDEEAIVELVDLSDKESKPARYGIRTDTRDGVTRFRFQVQGAQEITVDGRAKTPDGSTLSVPVDTDSSMWTTITLRSVDDEVRRWRMRPSLANAELIANEDRLRRFRDDPGPAAWAAPLGQGTGRPTAMVDPLGIFYLNCEDCRREPGRIEVIAISNTKVELLETCKYADDEGHSLEVNRFQRTARLVRYAARTGETLEDKTFVQQDEACGATRLGAFKGNEHVLSEHDFSHLRLAWGEMRAYLESQ